MILVFMGATMHIMILMEPTMNTRSLACVFHSVPDPIPIWGSGFGIMEFTGPCQSFRDRDLSVGTAVAIVWRVPLPAVEPRLPEQPVHHFRVAGPEREA